MLSKSMTDTGRGSAGAGYMVNGMSSASDPMFVDEQSYRSAMNVLNRGGVVRTRPGYNKVFDLPAGLLQGVAYFKPLTAEAYLVFAVSGVVYTSQFPFTSYSALANVQFYAFAPQVFFCTTVQSAALQEDGTVIAQPPKRVLMMQDGEFTRAAYWDGSYSGHLDPSLTASATATIDTNGGVASIAIDYPGTGYATAPTVIIEPPSAVIGATFRTATAVATVGAGGIQTITITDAGLGYTYAPEVSFSGQKLGTPLGGPMAWSGDRLWVAQGSRVMASDISNPIAFSENLYASGGGYFAFTEAVTALAEIPAFSNPNLAVFTRTTSSIIQSSIRDRATWQGTPNFQTVMFPGVGCVSHRSVVGKFGELWWMADGGFTNFNAAQQSRISSYLAPQDTAMSVSKFNLSSDLRGCCAAVFDNFMMLSVPYSSRKNTHTWVYDQSVVSPTPGQVTPAWASYWTGTNPVQWAWGPFNGVVRAFHVSVDNDGINRLWESFSGERTDNGSPITCFLETRTHIDFGPMATGMDLKRFVFAEVNLVDVLGDVNLSVYWGGLKGKYHLLADYRLAATQGSVTLNVPIGNAVDTYRSQVRRLRTPEVTQDITAECTSAGTEAQEDMPDWQDVGFSLLFEWTGQASIRTYRIFVDPWQESISGLAPIVEYDPRILTGAFCL